MSRRFSPNSRLLTSTALAVGLTISWSVPAVALAAPPALPEEQPATQPAPAQPAAEQPVAVQPAAQPAPAAQPQPQPQPAAQPQPQPTQPQPQGQPQVIYQQPPPPTYQQQPQPVPPPQPVQPTYNRNRGLGMTVAGFSIFGVSYLISAISATVAIDTGDPQRLGRPLLIPVAGPFISAARSPSATLGFGLGFVGVIQLAGLGMGIGGAVMLGKARRNAPQMSFTPGGVKLRF